MDTEIKKRGKQKNFFFIVVKESFYQSVLYEGREQVCQKSFVLLSWQGMKVKGYKPSELTKDPGKIELAARLAGV